MFLKRLALEILPLHMPIMFQCWQANYRLSTQAWSVSTNYVLLCHVPCRTWSNTIFWRRVPADTIATITLHEHVRRRRWCYLPCLYNNPTDRPVTSEKRVWGSASTLPIRALVHLKLIVMLNLTYYAETNIQESLSWTKKMWFPVCQRKWDCESHYGDNWSF